MPLTGDKKRAATLKAQRIFIAKEKKQLQATLDGYLDGREDHHGMEGRQAGSDLRHGEDHQRRPGVGGRCPRDNP